jgi:hypothetical protein
MISVANKLSHNKAHSFESNKAENKLIIIYQIFCKDPRVEENYIGQTECLKNRKYSHGRDSQVSDFKIYKIIRKNGGWDNWEMKIISHHYCNNPDDSRQIEQKYIDFFKTTMNSVRAHSKVINEQLDKELEIKLNDYNDGLGCFIYDFYLDNFQDKTACICKLCEEQSNKSDSRFEIKKSNRINVNKNDINYSCENCEKILSSKRNLEAHKQKCKGKDKFKCLFCRNVLSSKRNLDRHLICCSEKKKLEELKDVELKEMRELKEVNNLKDKIIVEKDKIIVEKDKIIVEINTRIESYKEQLKNQQDQIKDLQDKLYKIACSSANNII